MRDLGQALFVLGLVLAGAGLLLWKTGGLGGLGGLGRLPGDLSVHRPGMSLYFPVTTCLVLSLLITLLLWLFRR